MGEVGPLKTTVRITTWALTSVSGTNGKLTIKWSPSKVFTGYWIQYAENAAFTKNVKSIKITNPKTSTYVISNVIKGKTCKPNYTKEINEHNNV